MSEKYITDHFNDIKKYANIIENRINDEWCTIESVLEDNKTVLNLAKKHGIDYILIDDEYKIDIQL